MSTEKRRRSESYVTTNSRPNKQMRMDQQVVDTTLLLNQLFESLVQQAEVTPPALEKQQVESLLESLCRQGILGAKEPVVLLEDDTLIDGFLNEAKQSLVLALPTIYDSARNLLDLQPAEIPIGRNTLETNLQLWRAFKPLYVLTSDTSPALARAYAERREELPQVSAQTLELRDPVDLSHLLGQERALQFTHITAMFSMQHYFERESHAKQLFENLSRLLLPGGLFFALFRSGKEVLELTPAWKRNTAPVCFGARPSVRKINSAATAESIPAPELLTHCLQKQQQKEEDCLVFVNVLLKIAAQYGLVPVVEYATDCLLERDAGEVVKHLDPQRHWLCGTMTPEQKALCGSYVSIVLTKQ